MALPRIHAFEVNDTPQAPRFLRELIVESLTRTLRWGRVLRGLVPPFQRFLEASGATEVLDLCAGAAGPATILAKEMRALGHKPPRFLLTDLFPMVDAWERARAEHPEDIDFEPAPVDATRIPEAIAAGRARTVINAFHHFSPELAQHILADAVRGSNGIFISEVFGRNPAGFLPMTVAGLPALLATPALTSRDRLPKMAATWLTPLALSVAAWDGVVSTLRVYSKEDLFGMVAPFGDAFTWEFGHYSFAPLGRGTYFFGVPKKRTV